MTCLKTDICTYTVRQSWIEIISDLCAHLLGANQGQKLAVSREKKLFESVNLLVEIQ